MISVSCCGCIVVIRRIDYLSPSPCGWIKFVACCVFESWEPSFVEFQTFLFFVEVLLVLVDFNRFPVKSAVMIAGVVQYFSILKKNFMSSLFQGMFSYCRFFWLF